jgi:hypothetical protein
VERESSLPEESPLVAGVLLKPFAKGHAFAVRRDGAVCPRTR